MTTDKILIELFTHAENTNQVVRISFDNGEIYDLKILSTMHAKAGGDIVADVLQSLINSNPALWKTTSMNFKLDDVVKVEIESECLFRRSDS